MRLKFLQEGGTAPEAGGGNPLQQLIEAAAQAVQNNDAQMALQVCQALVQLAQQSSGGGEAGPGPEEGGGEEAPAEEPVYRRGGRLIARRRR